MLGSPGDFDGTGLAREGLGQRSNYSEVAEHSAFPRFQSKIGDGIICQQADGCWGASRNGGARDGEGFVGIAGGDRDDAPPKIFAC